MNERAVGSFHSVADDEPRLTIVVAASENGVIGRDGRLPWRLPADLRRFKQLTMGHAMIMGRKTYESIGRPLPGRVSIVLTRSPEFDPDHPDVRVAADLATAYGQAVEAEGAAGDEVFLIGGGEVYRLSLPHADRVHLTRVHNHIEGDATFPDLDPAEWRLINSERHEADEKNDHAFSFETWERRGDAAPTTRP